MQKHYLADIIEPVVEDLGYDTVRILTSGEVNPVLQIMIEHKDRVTEMTVEDCAKVSRAVSAVLDEKDPIENRYTLEVSSPGLDRPLTKLDHFKRNIGNVAKIETVETVENRKRFKGEIKSVTADAKIILETENGEFSIEFDNIAKAKIVLTDELWGKYLKARKDNNA